MADTWKGLNDIGFWAPISAALKRDWFQTLLHIAVTGLWLTPVIRSGAMVRILYMIGSAALHVYLSYLFAFKWENHGGNVIDGGPLGFLTWTIPAMVGTLACDAVVNRPGRPPLVMMSVYAILLMVLGYGFSCGTRLYDLPAKSDSAGEQKTDEINKANDRLEIEVAELPKPTKSTDDQQKKFDAVAEVLKGVNEQVARVNGQVDSVAGLKLRKKAEGKLNGIFDKIGAALNETLDEANTQIKPLNEELAKLKREGLAAKYQELKGSSEPGPWKKKSLINQAEADIKKNGYPNPRIAELETQVANIKVEWRFDEVKERATQLERTKGEIVDPKLATDAVIPSQSRIDALRTSHQEQGPKAVLAEAPFVPPPGDDKRIDGEPEDYRLWNYWMMSQRAGTISYLTFAAGFNLLAYVLFYILGDMMHASVGVFRTLGTNALAGYIAHEWVGGLVKQYMPKDVPAWYMWAGFAIFFYITYLFIRTLEKQKIFLRL